MDCFIISAHTDITALEIKELISKDCISYKQVCLIKDVSIQDLATLSYHAQSALRVCILISQTKDKENCTFKELDFFKDKTFGVEHIKIVDDILPSTDFASIIGGQLQDQTKSVVNLSHPEIKVVSCNDEEIFVGIDVVGFDMGKRPYKLMAFPGSISGAFAYCLLRLANLTRKQILVDPFCGSATLPIEAALFQKRISPFKFGKKLLGVNLLGEQFAPLPPKEEKTSIYGFDHQVRVMLTAQKNAKIAGVLDFLTISKVAVDWVDAKFEERTVDLVVTNPPKVNKRTNNRKQIEKLYDEFFYQAKYFLKSKHQVAMLLNKEDLALEVALKHKFSHVQTMKLFSGKQEYFFCLFTSP